METYKLLINSYLSGISYENEDSINKAKATPPSKLKDMLCLKEDIFVVVFKDNRQVILKGAKKQVLLKLVNRYWPKATFDYYFKLIKRGHPLTKIFK